MNLEFFLYYLFINVTYVRDLPLFILKISIWKNIFQYESTYFSYDFFLNIFNKYYHNILSKYPLTFIKFVANSHS